MSSVDPLLGRYIMQHLENNKFYLGEVKETTYAKIQAFYAKDGQGNLIGDAVGKPKMIAAVMLPVYMLQLTEEEANQILRQRDAQVADKELVMPDGVRRSADRILSDLRHETTPGMARR